ncbi:MAG: hypothetical protein N3J91_00820 [Verrucomicrobiae bacterium]|nr:hypothetical protein [Verrucomicrobiae bacterium]
MMALKHNPAGWLACVLLVSLLPAAAAPAYDRFQQRWVLPRTNYVDVTTDNLGATAEAGEPVLLPSASRQTVWFEWTPPTNGNYLITTYGSSFNTVLGIFTGNSVNALSLVAVDNDGVDPWGMPMGDLIALTNASASVAYKIVVDGVGAGGGGMVRLSIMPNNDLFADRRVVRGAFVEQISYNGKAGKEPYEHTHATGSINRGTNPPGKSLWWEWTPPAPGNYLISTYPSTCQTVLSVYRATGPAITNIVKVASDTEVYWGGDASIDQFGNLIAVTVTSTADVYRIAVDGAQWVDGGVTNTQSGQITLRIQPHNDHLSQAIALTGAVVRATGMNGLATKEDGEENKTNATQDDPFNTRFFPRQSVWWKWTPPANGNYLITTYGSMFNTFLGVLTNSQNPPTIAGLAWAVGPDTSDDNGASAFDVTSLVPLANARTNQTYYIFVDGAYDVNTENYGFIKLGIVPDNNMVANRIMLTGHRATSYSYNGRANAENREPLPPNAERDLRTLWWGWVAPTNGLVTIDTADSSFVTLLGVWTGNNADFTDYQLVAWNVYGTNDFRSRVSFPTIPGREYKIQVTGVAASEYGEAVVNLYFEPMPALPNDNWANAAPLSGSSVQVTATNLIATKEAGEPNHAGVAGGRSLWWRWTAPGNGVTTINTYDSLSWHPDNSGAPLDTVLAVYTGTALNALTVVATNNDDVLFAPNSSVTFTAVVGRTYYIAVDTALVSDPPSLDFGVINLQLEQLTAPPNDMFSNRLAIVGFPAVVTGTTVNATRETGEYSNPSVVGGGSVWWSWTAPFTGRVIFTTEGSSIDTVLAVFRGVNFNVANLLGQNDFAKEGARYSRLMLNVTSNTTYNISVEGQYGAQGGVTLKILSTNQTISGVTLLTNRQFRLTFPAFPAYNYEILYADDITGPWQSLDLITATNNPMHYVTPDPRLAPRRFYRVGEVD